MRLRDKEKKAIIFVKREERLINYEWNHYKIVLIILIILLTLESYFTGSLEKFFNSIGDYGYIGGIISGFLFTYGVTTPFAVASFFVLAETLDIWVLTILGALGGLVGEYFIYDFAKKESGKAIRLSKKRKVRLPQIKSKFLRKISPLIAGFIIASPIPDEFVAVLFGIEKYKLRDFLILTFIFKFIGILFIVGLGRII